MRYVKENARRARTRLSILPRPWPVARTAASNSPQPAVKSEARVVPQHATTRLEDIPEYRKIREIFMDVLQHFPEARAAIVQALDERADE